MSDAVSKLAPGVSAPLGSISQTDQSGLIAIIAALSLCFVIATSSIHVWIRLTKGPWKTDDSLLTAGALVACLQSALVFLEIHDGLGKVASLVETDKQLIIKKLSYATNLLYIIVLCLSKTSVSFLYLHLMQRLAHIRTVYTIIGASVFWCIMSILLICVECSWRDGCPNAFPRWVTVGVIDALTDAALAMMSIYMVRRLSTSCTRKLTVVCAFSTRFLVIPACAMRLYYLNPTTLTSNRTFALSLAAVCTQLQIALSIMTASISSFKPLVTVYEAASVGSAHRHNGYIRHSSSRAHEIPNQNFSRKLDRLSVNTIRENRPEPSSPAANPSSPAVSASTASLIPKSYGSYSAHVSVDGKPPTQGSKKGARRRDDHGMIIERKTCWSIHYDTDHPKEHGHPEIENSLGV